MRWLNKDPFIKDIVLREKYSIWLWLTAIAKLLNIINSIEVPSVENKLLISSLKIYKKIDRLFYSSLNFPKNRKTPYIIFVILFLG